MRKKEIGHVDNIKQLRGDTREHLSEIAVANDNILFWLDAHWNGGATYGDDDECQLHEELNLLFSAGIKNLAIMIDDARLFLFPPPVPHEYASWPSLKEIINTPPTNCEISIFKDVIYIYNIKHKDKIKSFIQEEVTDRWKI